MKFHIRVRACALIIKDDSVLLIEFNDTDGTGTHYNLPAGGVEPGETIMEAVQREAREEASVEVEVGMLALVSEHVPYLHETSTSAVHGLSLMFECTIKPGSTPKMPVHPDPNQIGVKWVRFDQLDKIVLYPNIKAQIIEYVEKGRRSLDYIEEHLLPLQKVEV
ncbi:NUDIX domain-containing protein [Fredinandcohnia humi]